MSETHLNEINESIELLSTYRERLKKEVINIAKKLQMPPSTINSSLEANEKLTEIKETIGKLVSYRNKQFHRENK